MITFEQYLNYQKIFIIIKPGFQDLSGKILEIFNSYGFEIDKMRTKRLLLSEAKQLYLIHKKEDWYKSLCNYMSSGISTAYILKRKAIDSNIYKDVEKIKEDIRKEYGESDMRNVLHSSDSLEHMNQEKQIYF